MKVSIFLATAVAVMGANYPYQWPGNFSVAFERSFFQFIALATVAIVFASQFALVKLFKRKERL
jgi:hypothetical protein